MRYSSSALVLLCGTLLFMPNARAQSATFASLSGATGLAVQRFDIDTPHSSMEFTVGFMGLSKVRGAFSDFGGTLMLDPADPSRSSITVVISTASINTNVAFRDKDLKSPNFFDAEKYPRIIFTSSGVERRPGGLLLRGPLTMHGVTREVAIPVTELHPLSKDAWGNQRIGWVGSLKLSRKEYGILGTAFWNSEYDPGRMSVSDEVQIDLTLEAEVSNVDRWGTPKGDSLRTAAEGQGVAKTLQQFRDAARDTASVYGKSSAEMLNGAALKLLHHRKYADGLEFLRVAAELNPERAWIQAAVGEAWLMNHKRPEATASFRRAIAIDSLNTAAREYLRHLEGKP